MKHSYPVIVASALALLMTAGCNKNSDPTPSMNAMVNNVAFSTIGPGVVSGASGYFPVSVTGTNTVNNSGSGTATTISLSFPGSVGSYKIPGNSAAFLSSPATGGLPIVASTGVVHVTRYSSGIVQGTFYFTSTDSALSLGVTGGTFTAKY